MANNLNIREVSLAEVSSKANTVNTIGVAYISNVKQSRVSVYAPMVVRVTNHPANTVAEENDPTKMALFLSQRHGEPWVMVGHQLETLTHPLPGGSHAPITDVKAYHTIYPDFDYTTFE